MWKHLCQGKHVRRCCVATGHRRSGCGGFLAPNVRCRVVVVVVWCGMVSVVVVVVVVFNSP
eukprot:29212-Prorocentrum_lima.AAC.1